MKTVIIFEYENSNPEIRKLPYKHAHNMGMNGGFYKVQIVDEFGIIEIEYK